MINVLKFGGSSIATTVRMKHVSEIISRHISNGNQVVVITSAMQGVTNQLIELTKAFNDSPFNREYDAVISSGEQVAAGLLAMCLNSIGIKAKSLNAWQIPIKAKGEFSNAIINYINGDKILEELEEGIVPIITGFQGISENADIYTIGRGGSDATACAVASVLNADKCYIYTDVDGVYTADPRITLKAKRLTEISYDEMFELASNGAQVLQAKSVSIAKQYKIRLSILSSFSTGGETVVSDKTAYLSNKGNIAGIAHNLNMAMVEGQIKDDSFLDTNPYVKRIASDTFIFPKTHKPETNNPIDSNIGIVTIVGKELESNNRLSSKPNILKESIKLSKRCRFGGESNKITQEITLHLKNHSIPIKRIYREDLSTSFIVPFQQTETTMNLIHAYLFE